MKKRYFESLYRLNSIISDFCVVCILVLILGSSLIISLINQGCHGAGSFSGPRARGPGPDTKRDPGGTPKLIIFQLSKGGPLFEKKSMKKSKIFFCFILLVLV